MTSAVIVSTARTPLAKSWKGAFNMTHGATLGGHAVKAAVERASIDAAEVDDVITKAAAAGATVTKPVSETFYGGYAGYFADPDGHTWEIAHNPGFTLTDDGSLNLPDFSE